MLISSTSCTLHCFSSMAKFTEMLHICIFHKPSSTKYQFNQRMHNSAAPQTSLFTATLHMFLLQFNTMRISDRQACYSCKFTHAHRSFTHFQHSLFLGCFYLGDLFLQLAVLSSQLPLHWINIEINFTPSWSFPSRRREAVLCETKICLNNLVLLKTHPRLYPRSSSSEFRLPLHSVEESGRKEAGSRDNKLLWVHGCWDPFFQLCSFSERTSGQHPRNSAGCTCITLCCVDWRFWAGGWS